MERLYTHEEHSALMDCMALAVSESGGGLLGMLSAAAKRVKALPMAARTKILAGVIASALAYTEADRLESAITAIADSDLVRAWTGRKASKSDERYRDVEELEISQAGIDLIKSHESLRLRGYDIRDGKITIGWGHAEPKGRSKYKLGQQITRREADRLLDQDLESVQADIKRRFGKWKSAGHDIPLTQEMYDALVSVAFNKGARGLFSCKFMRHLKKGDYVAAGKGIEKEYNRKFVRKFGGIVGRRKTESEMFLSGL